jgi:hypothetical protein
MAYEQPERYSEVEITLRGTLEHVEYDLIQFTNGTRIEGLDGPNASPAIVDVKVITPGPARGDLGIYTNRRTGKRELVMFRQHGHYDADWYTKDGVSVDRKDIAPVDAEMLTAVLAQLPPGPPSKLIDTGKARSPRNRAADTQKEF